MPTSVKVFDSYVDKLVGILRPTTVLDIGPGEGKYSHIVRNRAKTDGFQVKLTAIEIDNDYVGQFNLKDLYDTVIVDDAINIIKNPRIRFSLVIIGDCIEHMKKSAGIDLLNFLIY
jgi:16S rRNA A1518/A1519 N6-dimethyltransferase RsmA/KsgA/DIM1 with predicted DNA glycosylase/AP lyase activity